MAWDNVPAWTVVRDEGPDQRTPQLAPILQEIVSQPTWARGNAIVLAFQNAVGNTGRRTAEAKDGRIPPYLTLTFRTPLPNVAPIVNAGPNASVSVFGAASLVGTVTDDGKPGPNVTTTWSKASGPGTVTFASPGALATTATFSQAGTYTLRLTANDGALSGFDDVVITVLTTPTVNAGPNRTVTMPAAASLDGTVNGGGGPAQTTWSMVEGPGTVTFTNASAVDTTARFSAAGQLHAAAHREQRRTERLRRHGRHGAAATFGERRSEPHDHARQAPRRSTGHSSTQAPRDRSPSGGPGPAGRVGATP